MINRALELAASAHSNQRRKGTDIHYITHPAAVGIILASHGCCDEVIAAGILHDTVEDTGVKIDDIRNNFGDRVASIVKGCSEPDKSQEWEVRKHHTIEFLATAPLDIKYVACADKFHNLSTIAADLEAHGDVLWQRFNRGESQQSWYYRGLREALGKEEFGATPLYADYSDLVTKVFGE